jgi:hypothetical protein
MSFAWEPHVSFIEFDIPLFLYTSDDFMFIDPTEDFPIFPLKGEFEYLSIEEFLYLIGFLELFPGLVFCFFLFFFELLEALSCDLAGESLRDEHIACLRARDLDDLSLVSDVGDIHEDLYSDEVGRHAYTI